MKIIGLHIYGYGKFTDYRIDDLQSMQVFYGENEAGKSTIMSFIHSILFGFPTKQQSELRYEPKTHAAYGGRLHLETASFGKVVVERVKGKAAGDVTVLLEDGTSGGTEWLSKLLSGMDKHMYQNIFSFNLQGLQAVQRLKGEEIGRYLVAAGTIGTDEILDVELQLQKEMDILFKPNGRKPKLNAQIHALREQEKGLKLAKKDHSRYERLQSDLESLEGRLETDLYSLQAKKQAKDRTLELLNKWPLIAELMQIRERLQEVGEVVFPEEGMQRYEKLAQQITAIDSRLAGLSERISIVDSQIRENSVLEGLAEISMQVEQLIAEWPQQLRDYDVLKESRRKLAENEERMEEWRRDLQIPNIPLDSYNDIELGLDTKAKIREGVQQSERLQVKLESILAQVEHVEKQWKTATSECEQVENLLMDEQEFKELRQQEEKYKEVEALIIEEKVLTRNIEELRVKSDRQTRNKKSSRKALLIGMTLFSIIGIALFIWGLSTGNWVTSITVLVAILISFFSMRASLRNEQSDMSELDRLKVRLDNLQAQLGNGGHQVEEWKRAFDQQLRLREDWKNLYGALGPLEERLSQLRKEQKMIEDQIELAREELRRCSQQLGLDPEFSFSKLEDAFDLLKVMAQTQKETEKLNRLIDEKTRNITDREARLKKYAECISLRPADPSETIILLKETIKKEQRKEIILKELHQKRKEYQDEQKVMEAERLVLTAQLEQLLQSANTDDEEDFRRKARLANERENLAERKLLLEIQVGKQDELFASITEATLQSQLQQLESEIKALEVEIESARNQVAAMKHELQSMEEGGTYTEKLHQFYLDQSVLNEEARNWAKVAIAKAVLEETMEKLKKERFPKVMETAKQHMAFLTESRYTDLLMDSEGNLIIERKDGLRFSPQELSQGTGELLYTSLRFALVENLHESYPLPVMIDDGFVNFDEERAKRVLGLISQMSETVQILFFTCHGKMANHFHQELVFSLSRDTATNKSVHP